MATVQVRVPIVVEIDPDVWASLYGETTAPDALLRDLELRSDVTRYVLGAIAGSAAVEDGGIIRVQSG